MIVNERMTSFINSYATADSEALSELERYSLETNVPIVRKEMQTLIKFLLAAHSPRSVLEVGTAIGFSAVLMAENLPGDSHITTIEKYEKRIPVARENFKKFGYEDKITLLEGDATDILRELEGSYDFIFMDAAKGQYINFFPDVMRLLSPGGILLTDNVMQEGDILESKFAVERRNRTIYKRMRDYLYELTHNDELTTVILPIGDGVTISTKKDLKDDK